MLYMLNYIKKKKDENAFLFFIFSFHIKNMQYKIFFFISS